MNTVAMLKCTKLLKIVLVTPMGNCADPPGVALRAHLRLNPINKSKTRVEPQVSAKRDTGRVIFMNKLKKEGRISQKSRITRIYI
jgi:hypothetical protein